MSTHANMVKMTVSSVGADPYTITLNAASSGFQSFADAYGANATVDILITQGTVWDVARNCTYTHSGTTVTRGTFEDSSTGSRITTFDNTAVVSVVATADSGRRWDSAALEHVAGTDADTAMAVGNMYVVDMSAWATADRTYTLPADAAVGDRIGIMVTSGNASYELIIKPGASDTINGGSAAAEWSRLFITGEVVILRCVTANSAWVVEYAYGMDAYRFSLRQNGNATGQQTLATSTLDPIEGDVLNTTIYNVGSSVTNVGSAADVTFTARRAGNYLFGGLVIQSGGAAAANKKVITGLVVNGDTTDGLFILSRGFNNINGGVAGFGGAAEMRLAVGDTVVLVSFAEEASTAINQTDNYALFWGQWESV